MSWINPSFCKLLFFFPQVSYSVDATCEVSNIKAVLRCLVSSARCGRKVALGDRQMGGWEPEPGEEALAPHEAFLIRMLFSVHKMEAFAPQGV